jgi:putative endopeptidase
MRSLLTAAGALALALSSNCMAASLTGNAGLDVAGMDKSIRPGDDFFAYTSGKWVKDTEIPADRSTYGLNAQLAEETQNQLGQLMKDLSAKPGPMGSETRKIADFYASYMDEAGIEAKGIAPIKPTLDRIEAIGDRQALAVFLGSQLRADVDVLNSTNLFTPNLFGLWVAQDLDDPSRYVPFMLQGGLSLPSRNYYLDSSQRMIDIREKFIAHITKMLTLADIPDAEGKAGAIAELERRMAAFHWSTGDTFDIAKANNHWARAELTAKAPGLDWDAYFKAAGLANRADFVVWQPSAFTGLSALVASEPLDVWKAYLTYHAIAKRASLLPSAFNQENFAFFATTLNGTPKQQDRWKRATNATSAALGDAVGKLYVKDHFSPKAKAEVEQMVRNLIAAFDKRIDTLSWMSDKTKAEAKAKLKVLKIGVGYPNKWSDYSKLDISAGDIIANVERVEAFTLARSIALLDKPVDRDEWVMTPQTVNAVNLPALNALNFPAAELQPPHFDPKGPASVNYGAIGSIIGHENTHSFDDQGALFDSKGKLRNWWTDEDFAHFKASGDQLVEQYDGYKPFPDLAVNGRQTLSENIADVAGLLTAYDGYLISLKGKPAKVIEGYNGQQQFFLAFAMNWRYKAREQTLRRQILTDGHAPANYRALTVRNLDGWYDAFGITPDQSLYLAPDKRVRVW